MNDLAGSLDLVSLLPAELRDRVEQGNFEALFSELAETHPASPAIPAIEQRVREYFRSLQLPEEATLYDRLILSLRPRDLIATFNWDPLLFLAYRRNRHLFKLPKLAALHGSVAIGGCLAHRQCGYVDNACPDCGEPYQPLRLLYPVRQKNYQSDSFVAGEWDRLRRHMANGYWITIFGYGAPETDVEALQLLRDMATANTLREDGDVEIIDIKTREELHDKWKTFFVRSHFSILSSFEQSILAGHPRRASETLWMQSKLLTPVERTPLPPTHDLAELQQFAAELMKDPLENDAG